MLLANCEEDGGGEGSDVKGVGDAKQNDDVRETVGVFDRENIISARFDLARGFGIKASSGSKESGVDLNYRFEN